MNNAIENLQNLITQNIKYDNGCEVEFEFVNDTPSWNFLRKIVGAPVTVRAFTVNPKTKEKFLLKQVSADNKIGALEKILNYVNEHKKNYNSFTIKWTKKNSDSSKIEISYFYCRDAKEAIDKFFFNKERTEYVVYSIEMNSIA
jgi:hypothetical protein